MKRIYLEMSVYYHRLRRYVNDHRVVDRPKFETFRQRFYDQLWREVAGRMGAKIEDFGYGFSKISRGAQYTFVLQSKVMLDDHLSLRLAGNKPLVHRILSERNYPIQDYREYTLHSLAKAYDFMQKIGGACVVKPAAATGAGNGITTKIRNRQQLRKASLWAATFSTRLLIEKEMAGSSYRVLYLGGTFLDAVRRDSPVVIGDGRHSIAQLMHVENRRRLQGDEIVALSPLQADYECQLCLRERGYKLSTVPAAGETVRLKTVVNQNSAAENETVRASVHPSIIQIGAEIAALFRLELVGVDLITPDITKPLQDAGGVINEINTNPGLHHHYLIKNKTESAEVAREILEYILKR